MSEKLDITAKEIGGELIAMSNLLDAKMEKWSDVPARPNNLSDTECVGFINKETATAGLNLVIDVQAPANTNKAILRIWAIESKQDTGQSERFNNIQLDFDIDYTEARLFTQKGAAITRDDIHAALHKQNTRLSHMTISNQSGFDKASQQPLGERYDLAVDELDQADVSIDKINGVLTTVFARIKSAASVS